jgi:predicted aconitase
MFNQQGRMMIDHCHLRIKLSQDELDILLGIQGRVLQKVMQTVVFYGEALGAERLVDIGGPGHFVIPWSSPGIAPPIELLEELVDAGLKTKYPFTLDPRPPLDFENLLMEPEEETEVLKMYHNQARYDELLVQLGLRDKDAFTCNPYQPEVGNVPKRDTILAWSESVCVAYANSVLAARTTRNGAIIDLLSNIAGKTPLAGLLTDEGRKASWLIEIRTKNLPNPQLLGAAIGLKVLEDVPYITGLDRFLNPKLDAGTTDYLQEMGAACAAHGAVGLFHVENITPEAVDYGRDLLALGFQTYIIDDYVLEELSASFPILWTNKNVPLERCYIGCPHLSLRQLYWWADAIQTSLLRFSKKGLAVNTVLCAAPKVLEKFKKDGTAYLQLKEAGVKFSPTCSETIFETRLCSGKPILTNSTKLRSYTTARFIHDEALAEVLVTGRIG